MTPSSIEARSMCVTVERIIKFKVMPGCEACAADMRTRAPTLPSVGNASLRWLKVKRRKRRQITHNTVATLQKQPRLIPAYQDEEVVRALLGEPASSGPSGSHAKAFHPPGRMNGYTQRVDSCYHQPRKCLFAPNGVGDWPVPVSQITPGRTTRVVSQRNGSKEDISDG